jgi:hypothetical protein
MGRQARSEPRTGGLATAVADEVEHGGPAPVPGRAAPSSLLAVQHAAGNRATNGLVQAKLEVGAAEDPYEREADEVAAAVVHELKRPAGDERPSAQRAAVTERSDGAFGRGADVFFRTVDPTGSTGPIVQRVWKVEEYFGPQYNQDPQGLMELMLPEVESRTQTGRKRARERLREWALLTDSAAQVASLLKLVGRTELTELMQLNVVTAAELKPDELLNVLGAKVSIADLKVALKKVGDEGIAEHFKAVAASKADAIALIRLEPDLAVLSRLHAIIPRPPGLLKMLEFSPPGALSRGVWLEQVIATAGGWAELNELRPYSTTLHIVNKLMRAVPVADLLREIRGPRKAGLTGKAELIIALVPFGAFAAIAPVVAAGAVGDAAKQQVTASQLATGAAGVKMHPRVVRFTQETVTNNGDGYTVRDNIRQLTNEPEWDIPGPVRLFEMTADIARRAVATSTRFGDADPANLEIGRIYTLDNRRLYAYQQSGRSAMPGGQFVATSVVLREAYKFTTPNRGTAAVLV